MKLNKKIILTSMLAAIFSLTACLPGNESGTVSDSGQGSSTLPPDFTTTPDPTTPPVVLPPELPPPVQTDEEGFTINGGASFTTVSEVLLTITKYEALKMKISENDSCTGGVWEDFNASKNYILSRNSENKVAVLSIRFTDYDEAQSICFSSAILHDSKGPEILFKKYPLTSIEEGTPTEIIYDIVDRASGVASAECRLNDILRPCPIGLATVTIPGIAAGIYTFKITATDNVGHVSSNSISWEVTTSTRLITHDIHVDEYRKWDILFVIDNSGSMQYEQKNMADRARNFLSVLRGLDWQIAITTTDARNITLGNGRFIELSDRKGEYILNSSMNEEGAQRSLGLTLQRPETGSSVEQGIRSTYRSIERSQVAGTNESKLLRSGAHFAVVLISDEDESDDKLMNDPQELLSLVGSKFDGQKNFLFNSIITIPGDTDCRSTNGYSYGDRYKTMTNLTGGIMGSVCASDYANQVSGIAENIRAMAKSFTLSCPPLASHGVQVFRNGVQTFEPYTLDGVKLSFSQAVEPGDYQLKYHCLK